MIFKLSLRCYSTAIKSAKMRYLNVAEKNDAAKNIAQLLSRGTCTRREGLSKYNKIYEFDTTVLNEQAHMVMTSVSGHLLNYEFAAAYKSWERCRPLALFDAPIVKHCLEDYQPIKKTLEREIRSCNGLIIWTDCDREGENIGFEVIKVCTDIKPNLIIYRAKFSEITTASVFRALRNLGQPNKNVSDAVDVRQELDLRTGAAFTRLQTLRLKKAFPEKLADKLISYGSCQFPTLGFVVERYKAIEEFISEPFWRIKMNHTIGEITTEFNWDRDRLFNKNACEAILDICKENPLATVESMESKEKSKWRPLPLDTVEMEKNVSRKLKINAKTTMQIAEKLYTKGFISYPRTETNIFPKELNLTNLVQQQVNDGRWGGFAQRILDEGGPTPRQGRKSDQAHPPIHPTKFADNLAGDELRLYEYIVRHFLACLHKDAKGFETTVNVIITGEKFHAKGLIVLEKNYLEVYIYEKWNAKEINSYRVGDTFNPTVLDIIESSTTPPKLLTEADLIALMEKHGIGTDATHAEHIDKIKSREYVGLHHNMFFVPGTLGMGLVEGYNNIGLEISLAKPNLRAEFENDLKLICEGRKDPEQVRVEQIAKYKEVFQIVMDKMRLIDESLGSRLEHRPRDVQNEEIGGNDDFKPVIKCPKCGRDMILRNKTNSPGLYLTCTGYPSCKHSIWFPTSVETIEVQNRSCNTCGPDYKLLKMKFKQNLFPGEPNPNILCIGGCDRNVLDTLDISYVSVKNLGVTVNQNTSRNTTLNTTNHDQSMSSSSTNNFRNSTNSFTNSSHNTFVNNARSSTSIPPRNNGVSNNFLIPNIRPNGTNDNDGGADKVTCSCNEEAIQLTVKKEGPNQGRAFYKCASQTCNFFMWVSNEETISNNAGRAGTSFDNDQSDLKCNCNLPAVQKTVMKAGPNTGRQFYCCSKPMGQGCGFFKWYNEGESSGQSGNGDFRNGNSDNSFVQRNNKTTNKRSVPYNKQTRAKRKCGICGTEGHTKNKCPNK